MKHAPYRHTPEFRSVLRRFPWGTFAGVWACLLLWVSCAKMGQPDGGWYDEDPPRVLGSSPGEGATDVSSRKINIFFDEFIRLNNPTEKIVVSPPQLEQPEIKGMGKRISVELQDTLQPNTTYTIAFSDAIVDNNEGNPLDNFTYTFSTGDHIDTLEVGGYVLAADNLEPVKGILVGLYAADSLSHTQSPDNDTVFQTTPFLRVSRTDSRGFFSVKGVAEGRYRVFALQDADGNYMFSQKSETIGFTSDIFSPTWKPDVRQDTIWQDSLHIADIKQVPYTHFLPDDIVLRAFTELQTDRYLLKAERQQPERFTLFFSYGDKELPQLRGLNFDSDGAFIVEPSVQLDTISYWLRDSLLVNQDTLSVEITYLMTDSVGLLQPQTDTLEILSKQSYERRMKQQRENYEKWKKQQERNEKRGKPFLTEMPPEPLEPEYKLSSAIDPDQPLSVTVPSPLEVADTAAIHLYVKQDTLWIPTPFSFAGQAGYLRNYRLLADWVMGGEYSLELDSAAFVDIYGKASKPFKQGFKVKKEEEYAQPFNITLQGMKGQPCVVQLLSSADKVVKEVSTRTGVATFLYVKPATYYVRMIVDENDNGQWDTGNYAERRQPEAVYYYPLPVECRAKWDGSFSWKPDGQPLYQQKPAAITKQKADQKHKQMNRNLERAQKLGIEYVPAAMP